MLVVHRSPYFMDSLTVLLHFRLRKGTDKVGRSVYIHRLDAESVEIESQGP